MGLFGSKKKKDSNNQDDNSIESQIETALKNIVDPESKQSLANLGWIKSIRVLSNNAQVNLQITQENYSYAAQIELECNQALEKISGIGSYKVFIEVPKPKAGEHPHVEGNNHDHNHSGQAQGRLAGVKYIIAVASAKGGVGKSTVASNLAVSLSHAGHYVGLLDADIHGPSLPTLFGLTNQVPEMNENKTKMLPVERFGIKTMSVGFLMGPQDAAVLRGPMVGNLIQQFVDDVEWGELDYLVIDLPPGTGDAQLTLSQIVQLHGVIIVTTPQDVALVDVVRGIQMFKKVNTPILGIIENMSAFECPHCQEVTDIFSQGGGKKQSETMNLPFLGSIPIDLSTRMAGDEGKPISAGNPRGKIAGIFKDIASQVSTAMESASDQEIEIQI